jgi:hypothetical protein
LEVRFYMQLVYLIACCLFCLLNYKDISTFG